MGRHVLEIAMKAAPQRYVVDGRGKKQAVIVPLSEYRRLMEDLHDLAVVAERRKEGRISFRSIIGRKRRTTRAKPLSLRIASREVSK